MSTTFKIGIIGAGGIAGAHVAAAKASCGRVAVAAVADPVEPNRVKVAADTGAKAFASADDLLAAAKGLELGGVVVCTPPSARVAIIEKALAMGLGVLSEKPLAHTVADSRRLAEAARAGRAVAAVGYCHRFTPAVVEMKRLVAAGKIGRLTRFENVFACDLPGHESKWMSDTAVAGGGAFIDMGCHSLDLYHFMVGQGRVKGAVFDHKWPGRAESGATVLMQSVAPGGPNINPGVAGVIESGWAETERFTVAMVGTAGMLFYDYVDGGKIVFKDLLGKAEHLPTEDHGVRFTRQLTAFADSVQGGARTALATFDDGLLAAEAVEAAARAAAN